MAPSDAHTFSVIRLASSPVPSMTGLGILRLRAFRMAKLNGLPMTRAGWANTS